MRDVLTVVRACVAESLAVEIAEVHSGSRLVDDLGATSLDFIDIVFMLERELDISVRSSEFSFLTKLDFSSPSVVSGGFLTNETLDRLRAWLPAIDTEPDPAKITPRRLFSLITVETIVRVAKRQLDAKSASA